MRGVGSARAIDALCRHAASLRCYAGYAPPPAARRAPFGDSLRPPRDKCSPCGRSLAPAGRPVDAARVVIPARDSRDSRSDRPYSSACLWIFVLLLLLGARPPPSASLLRPSRNSLATRAPPTLSDKVTLIRVSAANFPLACVRTQKPAARCEIKRCTRISSKTR